jgi:hypothetical protein
MLLIKSWFFFAFVDFFLFAGDIIELDLVLFLVLENPIGTSFFDT